MFVKLQRVLANIPKNTKILFFGGKSSIIGNNLLLFAVNIWIKKPQVVNIQNIFLGIISHHTSLKEALIIIEDISIFFLHGLRVVRV